MDSFREKTEKQISSFNMADVQIDKSPLQTIHKAYESILRRWDAVLQMVAKHLNEEILHISYMLHILIHKCTYKITLHAAHSF